MFEIKLGKVFRAFRVATKKALSSCKTAFFWLMLVLTYQSHETAFKSTLPDESEKNNLLLSSLSLHFVLTL